MKKITYVTLEIAKTGKRDTLEIRHAERLLSMGEQQNGGWRLPKDSKYIFKDNELRRKTNRKDNRAADKD